ncbi:MAG TPA: hypothetical protein VKB78_10520, partial [Pirellulales bacterium]|nr:hypothetical protein [Pirellulales bacterium]
MAKLQAIEERVFVAWRLRSYGVGAVVAVVIALGWGLHRGLWLYRPDGRFGAIDFCWIWFSGNFARTGDPSQIYTNSVYDAAYRGFYGPSDCRLLLSGY